MFFAHPIGDKRSESERWNYFLFLETWTFRLWSSEYKVRSLKCDQQKQSHALIWTPDKGERQTMSLVISAHPEIPPYSKCFERIEFVDRKLVPLQPPVDDRRFVRTYVWIWFLSFDGHRWFWGIRKKMNLFRRLPCRSASANVTHRNEKTDSRKNIKKGRFYFQN